VVKIMERGFFAVKLKERKEDIVYVNSLEKDYA